MGVASFGLGFLTALIGVIPLLVRKRLTAAVVTGAITFLVSWWIYYAATPSFVWPMFGAAGGLVLAWWAVAAIVDHVLEEAHNYYFHLTSSALFPAILALLFVGRGCTGHAAFRANEYTQMIGTVEERVWTQDVQPKDPKHIRMVPLELARYLADKQIGEAGAIGSQFHVDKDHMTLQMVNGELWYAAPLDFNGFREWTSAADGAPGYLMVHGEDPKRPVVVKTGEHFRYTTGAWFGDELERHLWTHGYAGKGLTDYSFEIDDAGKPWWVVTVFEPTLAWSGERVLGVATVNPTTGEIVFHAIDKVPQWIDRVVPDRFVTQYLTWRGSYHAGWQNSWWGKHGLTEPETPLIAYGSDGVPYWVTAITSQNEGDEALIGLMYTETRTGKTRYYRGSGGTEAAVLEAVNNKVKFRIQHGDSPVLYNIYGRMAWIVPLLGESHTFQGVAIVDTADLQVAVGDDQFGALRAFQALIASSGQQIAPELAHEQTTLRGAVDRFAAEVKGTATVYYVHLIGVPHLFTSDSAISPKLPITRVGDDVELAYVASGEDVVPILAFQNFSLPLEKTAAQSAVAERVGVRQQEVTTHAAAQSARGTVQGMSDAELQQLLKLRGPAPVAQE